MPEIHSHFDNAGNYLSAMVDEWESLNRDYEEQVHENNVLREDLENVTNELNELRGSRLSDSGEPRTTSELRREIEKLKALVVELTLKLEEKIDAEIT